MLSGNRFVTRTRGLAFALFLGVAAASATAQTGPALLQEPWTGAETRFEADGGARIVGDSDLDGTGADLELVGYASQGRFRPSTDGTSGAYGYALRGLELDTTDARLPERLVDVSLASGVRLGRWHGWRLSFTGGLGFAGDRPFTDESALYGKVSVMGTHRVDEKRSWQLGLSFDGNRVVFPDVPLPMVSYRERVSPELAYALGIPFSSARWSPTERLTLSARTVAFVTGSFRARYRVRETVSIFAGFDSDTTGYHVEGTDPNRRLFHEQSRVEAGLRYDVADYGKVEVGGGYAFDRSFERGFDLTDTDTVREVEDAPFLRFAVELAF